MYAAQSASQAPRRDEGEGKGGDTHAKLLTASAYASGTSSVSGSNEYPIPVWPISSSAARAIQPITSTSAASAESRCTRAETAAISCGCAGAGAAVMSSSARGRAETGGGGACLVRDLVEDGDEPAQVLDGERGSEHLALLAVHATWGMGRFR